jgi:CRP-like cAMP-binding protein
MNENNIRELAYTLGEEVNFPKKSILISPEINSKYVYYILQGTLKQFYRIQRKNTTSSTKVKETIFRLIQEGDFCESATSLRGEGPSSDFVETFTEIKAIRISYLELQEKMKSDLSLANYVRQIIEDFYLEQEKRILSLLSLTPKERYNKMIESHSDWIGKFPDYAIASYLGITKETMSRFRAIS